jgi:UDP-N-acetyl-alpha-D-muramoyl-L-alanyl-L-glutamate epimerase
MSFDPTTVSRFRILGWRRQGQELHLRYALDDLELVEVVELAVSLDHVADDPRFETLCDLLTVFAGTSYYKAAAPDTIVVEDMALTAPARAAMRELYTQGLAEFRWTNGLALDQHVDIVADAASAAAPALVRPPVPRRALVPVGGGKDSIVSIELLRAAEVPTVLFTVGEHGPLAATANVAKRPRVTARRAIAPELLALNAAGARNGHVPITAITSMVALLSALGAGADAVVISNEHSSSYPTLVAGGIPVNHQFSKSLEFETLLREALAAGGVEGLDYFSLLRPMSELAILADFARYADYHHVFVSCNANYSVTGSVGPSSWCGHCPKCLFVYLGLAPFLAPATLAAIFGRDLLADPALTERFLALFALDETRPFECVGTPAECQAALDRLVDQPAWAAHPVVAALAAATAGRAREPFVWCHLDEAHHVPDALAAQLPCV